MMGQTLVKKMMKISLGLQEFCLFDVVIDEDTRVMTVGVNVENAGVLNLDHYEMQANTNHLAEPVVIIANEHDVLAEF